MGREPIPPMPRPGPIPEPNPLPEEPVPPPFGEPVPAEDPIPAPPTLQPANPKVLDRRSSDHQADGQTKRHQAE